MRILLDKTADLILPLPDFFRKIEETSAHWVPALLNQHDLKLFFISFGL